MDCFLNTPDPITLKAEEIKALCDEISGSNLSKDKVDLLIGLVNSNVWMQQILQEGRLTIRKLQKLFGSTTERRLNYQSKSDASTDSNKEEDTKPKGHGRLPEEAYTGAEDINVPHPDLKPGGECPEETCGGTLYEIKKSPIIIRIEGHPIASAKRYTLQSLPGGLVSFLQAALRKIFW